MGLKFYGCFALDTFETGFFLIPCRGCQVAISRVADGAAIRMFDWLITCFIVAIFLFLSLFLYPLCVLFLSCVYLLCNMFLFCNIYVCVLIVCCI